MSWPPEPKTLNRLTVCARGNDNFLLLVCVITRHLPVCTSLVCGVCAGEDEFVCMGTKKGPHVEL